MHLVATSFKPACKVDALFNRRTDQRLDLRDEPLSCIKPGAIHHSGVVHPAPLWDLQIPPSFGIGFDPMTILPRRFVVASLLFFQAAFFADAVHAVNVDLTTFPATGLPVPNGTVLSDQWRSIGILFAASPAGVDPIKDFGDSLFFNPDQFGNVAIFTFVVPGTTTQAQATRFSLTPFFNPGESAQLVGLDGAGNVVASDEVTPADIGGGDKSITMSISGSFQRVEWRTQGNPGIAADGLEFDLSHGAAAPAMKHSLLALISLCLVALGIIRLQKFA